MYSAKNIFVLADAFYVYVLIKFTGAIVRFQQENQTVSEDAGSVMVCVELMDVAGGLRRPVPFTITSGTCNCVWQSVLFLCLVLSALFWYVISLDPNKTRCLIQ